MRDFNTDRFYLAQSAPLTPASYERAVKQIRRFKQSAAKHKYPRVASREVSEGQFQCLFVMNYKDKFFGLVIEDDIESVKRNRNYLDVKFRALADTVIRRIESE